MEQAFPGKGHLKSPDEEIRRLQRENGGFKGGEGDPKKPGHLLKHPK